MASQVKKITSISVGRFYERHHEALKLRLVGDSQDGFERTIREPAPNRPGLALAGFFTYFANKCDHLDVICELWHRVIRSQDNKFIFALSIALIVYNRNRILD